MKKLSPYSMLGKSCRLISPSGRPETRPWTRETRSPQGPRPGGRACAAGRSAPGSRAPSVIARSATDQARPKASFLRPRPGRRPIHRWLSCAARRRGSPRSNPRDTRGLIGPAWSQCAPRSTGWPRRGVVTVRPPSRGRASSTATDRPRARSRRAAPIPAAPAPITATSAREAGPRGAGRRWGSGARGLRAACPSSPLAGFGAGLPPRSRRASGSAARGSSPGRGSRPGCGCKREAGTALPAADDLGDDRVGAAQPGGAGDVASGSARPTGR